MSADATKKLLICPGADAGELASSVAEALGGGWEVSAAEFVADGEASAPARIAQALTEIEAAVLEDRPDAVLIDGDDEATLAAALVFAKLEVPMVRLRDGAASEDAALAERLCDAAVENDPEAAAAAVRERFEAERG